MSEIKSTMILDEVVENKERKFGSNPKYFPCYFEMPDGTTKAGLFTLDQIEVAMERADRNQEDIDPEKESGLFGWLF